MRNSIVRWLACSVSAASLLCGFATQVRAAPTRYDFDLSTQPLGQSLNAVALAAGRTIAAPSALLFGRRAPALHGRYTAAEAYGRLLLGTGLELTPVGDGWVVTAPLQTTIPEADRVAPATPTPLSGVTVTGTRIRGQSPVGSELIVLDRSAIEASGYATTQALLQALPQNFGGGPSESTLGVSLRNGADQNNTFGNGVNLRGLGANSTLVLLNGERPALGGTGGVFADISLIPSSAVQRIEVLSDGASAIYGSDAVAGVVNIIFRDSFEGAETGLRYGSGDGAFGETQLSQLLGGSWGSGHAVFAYEYYQRGNLSAADRPYASEDLRALGGPDLRSPYAAPGTLIAGGQTYALGSTPLQAGTSNLEDNREDTDILPEQQRHSFYGSIQQTLGSSTTIYAQGLFAERGFSSRFVPDTQIPLTVPATNPFYVNPVGDGSPVDVEYSFLHDLGPQTLSGMVQAYDADAGVTQTFGSWTLDLRGDYGAEREYSRDGNTPNYAVLADVLAESDPSSAFNPFGAGGTNPAATVNAIRGYNSTLTHDTVWTAEAKIEGPLWRLPAGDLRLAAGYEHRREAFDFVTRDDEFSPTPTDIPLTSVPGPRNIDAGYGEVLAPLVNAGMGIPAVRRLDLSVAGRVEHYSDFGFTTNPKVGLSWSVTGDLGLRADYGTSFRAPSFNDLRQGPDAELYASIPEPDPKSSTGFTNAIVLLGNASNLKPETATTWNAGVDYAPSRLPGLKISLSYFDVDFKNRIASPTSDTFTLLTNRSLYVGVINDHPTAAQIASYYASPYFTNPYGIDASAVTAVIDDQVQNLSQVHQSGFDFDLGYTRPLLGATLGVGLGGTYILHVNQTVTPGAPVNDVVGTLGYPVRLRLRGRASFSEGGWQASAFVNFTDSYLNTTVTPDERVSAYTTLDLQLGYAIPLASGPLHGVRLSLSVSNLLNADPPFVVNQSGETASGFDPDEASPVGRLVSLQLVKSW